MKAYAIADYSDGVDCDPFLQRIGQLSTLSVEMIQLRAKNLDDRDLLDLATRCRERIQEGTLFLINGRADIAAAVDADGVHLPANGVPVDVVMRINPKLVVGRSCHSLDDVGAAKREGASFVVFGPVFDARSSEKTGSVSLDELKSAAQSGIGVFAIGGIDSDRIGTLEGTGIDGIAAITLFMRDEPIEGIVAKVKEART